MTPEKILQEQVDKNCFQLHEAGKTGIIGPDYTSVSTDLYFYVNKPENIEIISPLGDVILWNERIKMINNKSVKYSKNIK